MPERYSQSCCISADHPCLAGHFPANPIVPGVVVLDHVVNALQQIIDTKFDTLTVSTVKFLAPLLPAQTFIIELELDHAAQRAAFECKYQQRSRRRPADPGWVSAAIPEGACARKHVVESERFSPKAYVGERSEFETPTLITKGILKLTHD